MTSFLIVEDNLPTASSFVRMIRRRGDQATHAMSAQEALQELETAQYDVALIDGSLDQIVAPGRTITEIMKEHYPSTLRVGYSIVLMSNDSLARERYNVVLPKPVSLDEVYEAVRVARRETNRDLPPP